MSCQGDFPVTLLCPPEYVTSFSQALDHTCDHGAHWKNPFPRTTYAQWSLSSGTFDGCQVNQLVSNDHEVRKNCFLSFNLHLSSRKQKKWSPGGHVVKPGSSCDRRTQWQMLSTLASGVIHPLHIDWMSCPSAYHARVFQRIMQGDVFSRAPLRAEYRHIIWYLEETPWTIYVPRNQNWLIHDFSRKPHI